MGNGNPGFKPSHRPTSSMDLARQYSQDMNNITRCLFRETGNDGKKLKRYLSHVRVNEDSKSPSFRPPANSSPNNKKQRFLILSVKESGRIELHKAKESSNGVIQIGRTWDFDELTRIELDTEVPTGFTCTMAKQYYWETNSPKERRVWLTSIVEKYIKYTNGFTPELVNCDVSYFHLDQLYNQYQNKTAGSRQIVSNGTQFNSSAGPRTPDIPSRFSSNSELTGRAAAAAALSGHKLMSSPTKFNTDIRLQESEEESLAFKQAEQENKRVEAERADQERRDLARKEQERIEQEKLKQEKLKQELLQAKRQAEEREMLAQREEEERLANERLANEEIEQLEIAEIVDQSIDTTGTDGPQFSYDQTAESYDDHLDDIMGDYTRDDDQLSTAPLQLGGSANPPPPKLFINDNDTLDEDLNKAIPVADSSIELDKQLDSLMTGMDTLEFHIDQTNAPRERSRTRALSRVHDIKPTDDEFMDLLEEVGYDPIVDDSASLEKKMLKHLEKLQYNKIHSLAGSNTVISSLQNSLSKSVDYCDTVDPQFNLFSVQLSSFKDNVEFVESQGHGLQVLTTNKKLLKNELFEIVHSVDISDSEINALLATDFTLGYKNKIFEKTLGELYQALQKIRGDNNTKGSQLSHMMALKEKREKFESTNDLFIQLLKKSTKIVFEQISSSLTSKLPSVSYNSFESKFLKVTFNDRMAYLLTLSGMIAYVKEVSEDDYCEIIEYFKVAFQKFFDNLSIFLIREVKKKFETIQLSTFSFIADPKELLNETYYAIKDKKTSKPHINSGQKILEELGLGPEKLNVEVNDEKSNELKATHIIEDLCTNIILVLSMVQELVTQLFSISSLTEHQFMNLIKTPLEMRCEKFQKKSSYFSQNKESDRSVSDSIFEIMKSLFETTFLSTLKELSEVSRRDILQTPATLFILKDLQHSAASTNQEYIYNMFSKLDIKLSALWDREVEQQIKLINSTELSCQVMEYTKAYTIFFIEIQGIIDTLDFDVRPFFGSDENMNGNFEVMWNAIKSSLTKGIEGNNSKSDKDIDENELNIVIQRHLALLANYKWFIEETRVLTNLPKSIYKEMNDARNNELKLFIDTLSYKHDISKLIDLTSELERVIESGANPAITIKYSHSVIEQVLCLFRDDEFHRTIRELSADVSNRVKGTCCNTEDTRRESQFSIEIGKQIEKEIYNNCMNSFAQLYTTTMHRLTLVLSKYYTTVSPPYDKSNVNYYFKKTYL